MASNSKKVNIEDLVLQMKELQQCHADKVCRLKKETQREQKQIINDRFLQNNKSSFDTLPLKQLPTASSHCNCSNDNIEQISKTDDFLLERTMSAPPPRLFDEDDERTIHQSKDNSRHACIHNENDRNRECETSLHCVNCLRKSYRQLKQEIEYLKRENLTYRTKLVEEVKARQRLGSELDGLKSCLKNFSSNMNEKTCNNFLHDEALSKGIQREKEQITNWSKKEVRTDKYMHVNSEELRMKNRELEHELRNARKTIKLHEQRLFMFSSQLPQNNSKLDHSQIHKPFLNRTNCNKMFPTTDNLNHITTNRDSRLFSYCYDDIRRWQLFDRIEGDKESVYSSISSERYESLDVKPR